MVSTPRKISPLLSAVHNRAPRLQQCGCGALGLPSTRVRGLPAPSSSIKLHIKSITSLFRLRLYTSQTSALPSYRFDFSYGYTSLSIRSGCGLLWQHFHICRPPPTLKLVRVAGDYGLLPLAPYDAFILLPAAHTMHPGLQHCLTVCVRRTSGPAPAKAPPYLTRA